VMKLSRRLIVHGEHTRQVLIEHHDYRRPIDVARHPSYIGWYKDEVTREQARAKLGLPDDARVYLYFGYIKPYKGVEDLIQAFGQISVDGAILLIAGKPLDETIKQEVESMAAAASRVRTFLGYIADDDIQVFFRSADVVVFPFKNTQTSGSLMLAMSYGCPIIAPRIATLPEYVDNDMGFLFDPESPGALEHALDAAARAPLSSMAVNARRRAETMRWDTMARSHLASYQSITD